MNDNKVDILLATYNGEKYLKEQIDSILNQTYKNFNLIISDDFSKDGTVDILKEYEKKDSRITLYLQEENLGSNKNFEFLLSKISSDYYMFSDQDDVWHEDKIEICLDEIIKKNVDLVFTDLEIVDENLNLINKSFNTKMKLIKKITRYNDYRLEYLYNCVTGCTMLAKSSNLESILPFPKNKDILHDYWISLITSISGKILYIPKTTIKYRQHSKNQIGTVKYTDKFLKFDEKRDYIIDLKINKFKTYIENEKYFNSYLKDLNILALDYFIYVKRIKNINFKNWKIYHNVFKYESLSYYLFYFVFYNFPCIFRLLYNISKCFIKNKGECFNGKSR